MKKIYSLLLFVGLVFTQNVTAAQIFMDSFEDSIAYKITGWNFNPSGRNAGINKSSTGRSGRHGQDFAYLGSDCHLCADQIFKDITIREDAKYTVKFRAGFSGTSTNNYFSLTNNLGQSVQVSINAGSLSEYELVLNPQAGATTMRILGDRGNLDGYFNFDYFRVIEEIVEFNPPPSTGKPFTCQAESFVSFNTAGSPKDGESKFDIIGLADGKLKKSHILTGASGVNSIGYNIKDNFVWGYNLKENKLVKIDANQNTTLYDLPEDLPAGFYISADVDKNGILHLSPWNSSQIYRVNVDSTSDNFLEVLEPLKLEKKIVFINYSTKINTGDMAFNPQDGYLYYIEKGSNGKVYKVDPSTGLVSFVVDSEVNPNVIICFFDASGNFYFNLGVDKLYKINMNDPKKAEPFSSLDKNLRNGDGARCANAEVEEITLTPGSCTEAPQDIITFSDDFDFDKATSVSGSGEVGTIATYQNVAIVNGEDVDLKVEVLLLNELDSLLQSGSTPKGFKLQSIGEENSVGFFLDQKRLDSSGTEYNAELKFSFVKHDTNTPISFSFETHVFDIDNFENRTEYVRIDKNDYKFFQTSEDTHIAASLDGNWATFTNSHTEDSRDFNTSASVKFVHENISEVTMKFTHKKNKNIGTYSGKAGFNIVFGSPGNGLPSCQSNNKPFTCSPEAYLFTGSGLSSAAYKVDLSEKDSDPSPLEESMTNRINATGYNVKDNFIWGYEINDHKVIRIDSNMVVNSYEVEDLPDGTYLAGDVSQDGVLYLKAHNIDRLYKVDLNSSVPEYNGYLDLNETGINLGDFAFNPVDSKLYAISESNGHLYSVDSSNGNVGDLGSVLSAEDVKFHTFVFDRNGYLYFYGSEGIIYKIDLSEGTKPPYNISPFSTTNIKVGGGDGAKCPNSEVEKSLMRDFGDAPDDRDYHKSKYADNYDAGDPRRKVSELITPNVYLGNGVTSENRGHFSENADGDSDDAITNPDDLIVDKDAGTYSVTVHVSNRGSGTYKPAANSQNLNQWRYISAWIDWDNNGIYDNNEMIQGDLLGISKQFNGTKILTWNIPSGLNNGDKKMMRIRLTECAYGHSGDTEVASYGDCSNATNGSASFGEIEDYVITIGSIVNDIKLNAMTVETAGFDGNITTQIVNQSFDLIIKAYDFTKNEFIQDMNITKVEIINNIGAVSEWNGLKQTDSDGKTIIQINANKAIKIVSVKIYGDYNGGNYNNISTDDFAIRPDKFIIAPPKNLKAGEPFSLGLKALDKTGNPTNNYNEVIKSSFDIKYKEDKVMCDTGDLNLSSILFANGIVSKDVNYTEVGKLDFNISEIIGSEFALIDQDDTSDDAQRLITMATASGIEFSAGKFEIENWSLNDGANDFTYYAENADLEDMGAELNATIKAVSMTGKPLENYRSGCYAKDTNLTVDYNADVLNILNWKFLDNYGQGDGNKFTVALNKTRFDKGVIAPTVHINFERKKDKAKNPLRLTIDKLEAVDEDGVTGSDDTNENSSDFYYGRMNTPDYTNSGRDHDITVYHEVYCKGCDKSDFIYANKKESKDSINWYITTPQGKKFESLKPVNDGLDEGDIMSNRGYATSTLTQNSYNTDKSTVIWLEIPKPPLKDRFTYVPPSWLIFNRFKSNATTNSCRINITSTGEWSGKGKAGTSVDLDVSSRGMRKMDW